MGIFNMFGGGFDKKLEEARATQNARIIDVRTSGEYRSGHVPGAENVPLDRIAGFKAAADLPCSCTAKAADAAHRRPISSNRTASPT